MAPSLGVGRGHTTTEGTHFLCACNRCSTFLLKHPKSCQASASPGLCVGGKGKELEWLLLFCGRRELTPGGRN